MQKLINQGNFPYLWLLFQYILGGNVDKKRLILSAYQNEARALEVGCSVGNIADAFRLKENLFYQGIDIDCQAVAIAQRRFKRYPRFSFKCEDLTQFAQNASNTFNIIYFAGILHHVNDEESIRLLQSAVGLLETKARLVIVEPSAATAEDSLLVRWYANRLEQGEYLRSKSVLEKIVDSISGLTISHSYLAQINATPLRWPLCANFIVIEATRNA